MTKEEYLALISTDKQIQYKGIRSGIWWDKKWEDVDPREDRNRYRIIKHTRKAKRNRELKHKYKCKENSAIIMLYEKDGMIDELHICADELLVPKYGWTVIGYRDLNYAVEEMLDIIKDKK